MSWFVSCQRRRAPVSGQPQSMFLQRLSVAHYSATTRVDVMKILIMIASAVLLLVGCAVGPNYRTPDTPVAVLQNVQSPAFVQQTPDALWWSEFDDTELDDLERRALGANLDLRSAYDRVRAARAVFVERNYDYAPHVDLESTYSKSEEQQPGFGTNRFNIQSDSLGFDATWAIDLFGHVRRSVEAARGDLGAE